MPKIWTSLTIDPKLLEKIDTTRREKALKDGADISRSKYVCDLLEKALKEVR